MQTPLIRAAALWALVASLPALAQTAQGYEFRAPKKGLAVSSGVPPAPAPVPAPAPAPTLLAQLSAGAVAFDAVTLGASQTKQLLLSNIGTGSLILSGTSLSGAGFTASTNCESVLAPGASCQADLTFTPGSVDADTGTKTFSGSFQFLTNASSGASPVVLSGEGRAPWGVLSFTNGATADFGSLTAGTSSSKTLSFSNTGPVPASGVQVSVSGTNLSLSANTCGTSASPGVVPPGGSCAFTITWAPGAAGALVAGQVTVSSSAANSPMSQPLSGSAQSADPSLASISALLKFDGAEGATTFVDELGLNTVTRVGTGTSLSAAAARFGTTGLQVTVGKLALADKPSLNFGAGDFTVEFWFKLSTTSGSSAAWRYLANHGHQPSYAPWSFVQNGADVNFYMSSAGCSGWNLSNTTVNTSALSAGTWYHVAASRTGSSVRVFLNGVQTRTLSVGTSSLCANTQPVNIGADNQASSATQYTGAIDDFRITKGVGRYTTGFTPVPATAY